VAAGPRSPGARICPNPKITVLGPTSSPRMSTVMSGQLRASAPKITLAAPASNAIARSSASLGIAVTNLATPPSTMQIPATMASAWIVLPAEATTAIPAAIHPSPTRTDSARFRAFLAATSSLTPVARKAPATNRTSASRDVNGLSVKRTPTTAHTTPSNSRAQGRVTR